MPYRSFLWHNFLIINILSISGLIVLIQRIKSLEMADRKAAWIFTLLALLLSTPLIGIEWALRYHMMAWLPIAFQYIFVFRVAGKGVLKPILTSVFALILTGSLIAGLTGQRKSAITVAAFRDLEMMHNSLDLNENDLVVARHGLEWWAGWTLRVRTGKEYCLRPDDWEKYRGIYLLRQKKGNNFPIRPGTNQFAELPPSENPDLAFTSDYFDLIRLGKPGSKDYSPGILPILQGRIISAEPDKLIIRSSEYDHLVKISRDARFIECSRDSLRIGQRADIWGKRKPFSINLYADIIRAY
jgi:hypothetical protein